MKKYNKEELRVSCYCEANFIYIKDTDTIVHSSGNTKNVHNPTKPLIEDTINSFLEELDDIPINKSTVEWIEQNVNL